MAQENSTFEAAQRHRPSPFTAPKTLEDFEGAEPPERYTMGPGDQITVTFWGHDDLSGKHVIGPDGRISLPVLGSAELASLTTDEAGHKLSHAYADDYLDPAITVEVDSYASNSVLVLGRVSNPGVIHFDSPPTLLEALTRAGTLPIGGIGADKAALNRCAIFRGRHELVWINLRALLKGRDLSLNIRLHRGDIVYIPDADDQLIYVMGQVTKPGAYQLTPDLSFMDAIAQAGGPLDGAAMDRVILARPSAEIQATIDMNEYLKARGEHNYKLEEGDVIYVPMSKTAKLGYFFQQISPVTQTMLFSAAIFK